MIFSSSIFFIVNWKYDWALRGKIMPDFASGLYFSKNIEQKSYYKQKTKYDVPKFIELLNILLGGYNKLGPDENWFWP